MFDMHIHIIPGIDDGAKDESITRQMLRIAAQNGTTHMVATPHVIEGDWLPAWEEITGHCQNLRQMAEELRVQLQIFPGGEIAMSMDILDLLKGPGSYCINGGRYLLVEFPAAEIPDFADDFFFTLQTRGITPVIAHPERHPVIARRPELLAQWINKGILTQVNCSSLTGKMGERAMKTAELLAANQMIYLLGSDAHGIRTRNPDMTEGIGKLGELTGPDEVRRITYEHPLAVVNSRDVATREISRIVRPESPGLLKRLFHKFR